MSSDRAPMTSDRAPMTSDRAPMTSDRVATSDRAPMTSDRAEAILASIRQRGGRASTARRAIIDALLRAGRHVTVEDLAAAVQSAHPDIHVSTVYRTVEALQELGVVYHVHMGHGPAHWHLADERHLHLVCQGCGTVAEAPAAIFEGVRDQLAALGFVPDPRHFALVGWCAACHPPGARRRRR